VGGSIKRDIFHLKQPSPLQVSDANTQRESTPPRTSTRISGTSRDLESYTCLLQQRGGAGSSISHRLASFPFIHTLSM
jgi:hypothetical protein